MSALNKSVAALVLAMLSTPVGASVVYDNLFQKNVPGLAGDPLNLSAPLGASFTTGSGSGASILMSLDILLSRPSEEEVGSFVITIVPDSSNTPDLLASPIWSSGILPDSMFSDNTGNGYWDLGFTLPGVAVSTATRYWVVLDEAGNEDNSSLAWIYTSQNTGVGVPNEFWWSTGAPGPNETGPYVMRVTDAPEPFSISLLGVGLIALGVVGRRVSRTKK